MFLGLLNLVKIDLVRARLQSVIRIPINRQQRPMVEIGQVFAHL